MRISTGTSTRSRRSVSRAADGGGGSISSFWGESENNRRAKYYLLTKMGRSHLDLETKRWGRISLACKLVDVSPFDYLKTTRRSTVFVLTSRGFSRLGGILWQA